MSLLGGNLGEQFSSAEQVASPESSSTGAKGLSVPVNQTLTPAGLQVEFPGVRPQVLALSPDGKLLATGGKHELVLLDPNNGKILQNVQLPLDTVRGDV